MSDESFIEFCHSKFKSQYKDNIIIMTDVVCDPYSRLSLSGRPANKHATTVSIGCYYKKDIIKSPVYRVNLLPGIVDQIIDGKDTAIINSIFEDAIGELENNIIKFIKNGE